MRDNHSCWVSLKHPQAHFAPRGGDPRAPRVDAAILLLTLFLFFLVQAISYFLEACPGPPPKVSYSHLTVKRALCHQPNQADPEWLPAAADTIQQHFSKYGELIEVVSGGISIVLSQVHWISTNPNHCQAPYCP